MTKDPMLDGMTDLALAAGARICEIYNTDFDVETKADGSAVTEADQLAEGIILEGLMRIAPQIPVLAEEAASAGHIPELGDEFFLVDPLDGTREFVNRTGEFTVNIALIRQGQPVMGVVYAPGSDRLYYGAVGAGAWARQISPGAAQDQASPPQQIRARQVPASDRVAVASRSHRSAETETFLHELRANDFTPAGSSLKFCLVAEGKADVYPRLGRTMEWDTGAGQAVLVAAGGTVLALDADNAEQGPLSYGKASRGFDNPHFIAWGARDQA